MVAVVPRLPVATGHAGTVQAGVGLLPGLDSHRPVAWFRGTALVGDAEVIRRTIVTGVEAGVPVVGVITGVGADVRAGVHSLVGLGEVSRALAGAAGIVPTVLVVDGPCLGGGALALGLADLVVMTDRGHAFVNAPATSARFTGTDHLDADLLGGAWVHHTRSGVADLVAPTVEGALALVGDVLDLLPANNHEAPPTVAADDPFDRPSARAAATVPHDGRASYDMRTVIEDLVDDGHYVELRARYGNSVTTGLARIAGMPVGVLANQPSQLAGALDIEGSKKGGRFIRFCDAFGLPIVTLVDTPGFRPGRDQEWRGMIRHGAKLAFAYAEATVPRVSVVLRKAYGGAYIVMGSKHVGADLNLAWPTAEIAVMGPEGAVDLIYRKEFEEAADADALRAQRFAEYRGKFANPYVAASYGYVDDVIEPSQTRAALINGLQMLQNKRGSNPAKKHGTMPL